MRISPSSHVFFSPLIRGATSSCGARTWSLVVFHIHMLCIYSVHLYLQNPINSPL